MARLDADYPRLLKVFARHGLKLRARAPETSHTVRHAELSAIRATGDMPTRLAASLENEETIRKLELRK